MKRLKRIICWIKGRHPWNYVQVVGIAYANICQRCGKIDGDTLGMRDSKKCQGCGSVRIIKTNKKPVLSDGAYYNFYRCKDCLFETAIKVGDSK